MKIPHLTTGYFLVFYFLSALGAFCNVLIFYFKLQDHTAEEETKSDS